MDTGGCACAAAAAHRVVAPAASAPVGAKRRPDLTDGACWTGTKKNKKTPCSPEYQVHGSEGGDVGETDSTAVVTSRKRPYEYSELELDVASDPEKMFKCNYWEDPAYAKKLEYFGLRLARSAAHDNTCDRLIREHNARMAAAAAARIRDC